MILAKRSHKVEDDKVNKQEMFKDFLRNHSTELVVMTVGTAISFMIGLVITGDFSDAFARATRR